MRNMSEKRVASDRSNASDAGLQRTKRAMAIPADLSASREPHGYCARAKTD